MAGEAVAIALEVGWHTWVGLFSVGVDTATQETSSHKSLLCQVLHEALATAAAMVHEDDLAISGDGRLQRVFNRFFRPLLPLVVRQMAEGGFLTLAGNEHFGLRALLVITDRY